MHPLDKRRFALGRNGSGDRAEHNERALREAQRGKLSCSMLLVYVTVLWPHLS
jgi:hypothetical protein